MKIIINKFESYELVFPETITVLQYMQFLEKFSHIGKLLGKDTMSMPIPENQGVQDIKIRKPRTQGFTCYKVKDRNEAVELLMAFYENQEKQEVFAKRYNTTWKDIRAHTNSTILKRTWNIKPEEIGLTRFPAQGESKTAISYLKIKNE